MRFGYVILGLVTMTSIHISSGQECSNGLAGFQNGDVCCDSSCGACGGGGCNQLPGGADSCCTGRIRASGMMCSATMAAPCMIDDEVLCSNGVPGVQFNSICCEPQCGTCGGTGCARRPGGAEACCSGRIRNSGVMCSTSSEAPCIIDDEVLCSNGLPGVQNGEICCEAQCGTCGGRGCGQRPGGTSGCCAGRIEDSFVYCSDSLAAPCIIH